MRYTKLLSLLVILLISSQCKTVPVAYYPTSEFSLILSEGDQVTLRVLGYGVTEQDAILDAQISSFDNIFFRGIPNSAYSDPLIGFNENEIRNKNVSYFKQFYKGKRLLTFINNFTIVASGKESVVAQKVKNKRVVQDNINSIVAVVDVTINMKSIRRDLEANKIISSFGY